MSTTSMIIGEKGKDYGLKSFKFNEEDDDSQDINKVLREANEKKAKKQNQVEQSKVLAEDPTAYDYDSVYDAMNQAKQPPPSQISNTQKPSKYIGALKEKAAIRKVELSIAHDRKAQRERKEEGEMFAGKEKFVTSAYKDKLKGDKAYLEEEARKAALEEDVTKKGDLTTFYTSLLTKNEAYGGGRRPSPLVNKEKDSNKRDGNGVEKNEKDEDKPRDREVDRNEDSGRDRNRDRERDGDRDRDSGRRDYGRDRDRDSRRDDRRRSRSRERERERDSRRDDRPERRRDEKDRDNKKDDPQINDNSQPEVDVKSNEAKRPAEGINDFQPKKTPRRNDEESVSAAKLRYLQRTGKL